MIGILDSCVARTLPDTRKLEKTKNSSGKACYVPSNKPLNNKKRGQEILAPFPRYCN